MMPRRSSRLEATDYYDSEGKPSISYKENLQKVFRNRRRRPRASTGQADPSFSPPASTGSGLSGTGSRRRKGNSRGTQLCLFLCLCFGLTYLMSSASVFLSLGHSESSVSSSRINKILDDREEDMKIIRELQDEVLKLRKKINYLLPDAQMKPNFALNTLGASIVSSMSSETYKTGGSYTFFGIPISRCVDQLIVIKGASSLIPGNCWPFAGARGHLTIALSHQAVISHVSLGHIPKSLSVTGNISSAPKVFSVYGLETLQDHGTKLGTFLYDQDGDSAQTFKLPDHQEGSFKYVRLQVESNWGHPEYTCVYNFKVHGEQAD